MNKVDVVIAEDQPLQAEITAAMIKSLRPAWRVVATVASATKLLDVLDRYQPDLALLDISLADSMSGLDIAAEVGRRCPFIFITGHPDHALAAFDAGAADYVVKPIRSTRMEQALLRFEQIMRDSEVHSAPQSDPQSATNGYARYMQLTSGRKHLWTAVGEIRYLQAETGYTQVFLNGYSGHVRHSLQAVSQRLDRRDFWQIHRSTVINARFVQDVERDEIGRLSVRLQDYPNRLLIARNQERLFKDDFLD